MSEWAILIFMAADNDLDRFALKDLHEMERQGSNNEVKLIVQVDRYGNGIKGSALRGVIEKNPNWVPYKYELATKLEDIGETNTGDPATLVDFIGWAVANYPAKRYALVVWNHGSGWKPDFIYEKAEELSGARIAGAMRSVGCGDYLVKRLSRTLFRRTAENSISQFIKSTLTPLSPLGIGQVTDFSIMGTDGVTGNAVLMDDANREDLEHLVTRAIGLDESSNRDALDSIELKTALHDACLQISTNRGAPFKFDVIGFDACLMAGVEVIYQLREYGDYFVCSEEIEPAIGWSYDRLVRGIVEKARDANSFAIAAVAAYAEGMADYKIRLVTQSAIASGKIVALIESLNSLGEAIDLLLSNNYGAIAKCEKQATRFYDTDFLDIKHFLSLLTASVADARITSCAEALSKAVIANEYLFAKATQNPGGLSVYFPTRPSYDPEYARLDIAAAMPKFVEVIKKYHFLL